jgi:transcriptional regulator with PAS, ATPase and Fis domain
MGINAPKIDKHGLVELCNYNWPGNVRELENLIEKLMIFSDGRIITKEDVIYGLYADEKVQLADVTCQSIAAMEKRMILAALDRHGMDLNGKKTAAKELGISLTCLYDKLKKYSVN